jgi:hypothetical protein
MASTSQDAEVTASSAAKAQDPVEMSTLQSPSAATTEDAKETSTAAEPDATAGAQDTSKPHNRLTRAQSEALGPATENIQPPLPTADRGPSLSITLMLTSGARHPYKIDEKYLRSRKVEIAEGKAFDPRDISGYKLKELIWTDWRDEWEPRPQTPTSIRLIILGRFVEDKTALKGEFSFMW